MLLVVLPLKNILTRRTQQKTQQMYTFEYLLLLNVLYITLPNNNKTFILPQHPVLGQPRESSTSQAILALG